MKSIVLALCLVAAASGAVVKEQSVLAENYFSERACSRSLPSEELNACIKRNIQYYVRRFTEGEKLLGLDPLDPLSVGDTRAAMDRAPLNFLAVARNNKVRGISGIIVRDVRASLSDDRVNLDLEVTFPKFLVEGDFKTEGKLGSFPFSGKGPFNMSFTDLNAKWNIQGIVVERDGDKYIQIKRYIPDWTVSSMKVWAENIVTGAPELTQLALTFVNEFWEAGTQIMAPVVKPEFEKFLKEKANIVFNKVPYEKLFPSA